MSSELYTVQQEANTYRVTDDVGGFRVEVAPDEVRITEAVVVTVGADDAGVGSFVYVPPSPSVEWLIDTPPRMTFRPNVAVVLEDGTRLSMVPVVYDPDDVHRVVVQFTEAHGAPAYAILS